MKSIVITKSNSGQRLDRIVLKQFETLPKSLMFKEIRKKNIKVNKKRCTADQRMNEGDVIELYLNDEVLSERVKHYDFTDASKDINIIYEDDNIIVADKPVGLLCHPDGSEYVNTLITRIKRYLYDKNQWSPDTDTFTPALANRIDRNTGGLVIAAKNSTALAAVGEGIKSRSIKKYYLAVLSSVPIVKEDTLTAYITKDDRKNLVTVHKEAVDDSKKIVTKYKIVDEYSHFALAEIDLLTGRTHQIRAHMASIGCPLANDGKYGNDHGRFRQALYSYKLIMNFEENSPLAYLNGKTFEVKNTPIEKKFKERAYK